MIRNIGSLRVVDRYTTTPLLLPFFCKIQHLDVENIYPTKARETSSVYMNLECGEKRRAALPELAVQHKSAVPLSVREKRYRPFVATALQNFSFGRDD